MGNPEIMVHMGQMNASMPYDEGNGMMPNQMMHGSSMHGGMMPGGNSMSGGGVMPGNSPMLNNTMMGHPSMPGANMNNAGMMPGDMPMKNSGMMGSSMYSGSGGMMNSVGPHNSGMAPTSSMPHCSTMINEGMPDRAGMMSGGSSDNISVQDPFADDVGSQYPTNKPTMSGGMTHSQQNAMPSSYGNYGNRGSNMNSAMATGNQPGPYGDGTVQPPAGSSVEQFGSLYHGNRGSGPDGFSGTRAMQDSFGSRMPGCGMANQFGQYQDR